MHHTGTHHVLLQSHMHQTRRLAGGCAAVGGQGMVHTVSTHRRVRTACGAGCTCSTFHPGVDGSMARPPTAAAMKRLTPPPNIMWFRLATCVLMYNKIFAFE